MAVGLLGTCLSGAGPTVLALATGNCDFIGKEMKRIFESESGVDEKRIEADYMVLEFDNQGVSWERSE